MAKMKRARGRPKRILSQIELKRWLIANPKKPHAGRCPRQYNAYLRSATEEEIQTLVFSIIQVLLNPEDRRSMLRRTIYIKLPWDYQKRMPDVFSHARIVEKDPSGWWVVCEYNPYKLLDRVYKAGLCSFSPHEFAISKRAAAIEFHKIAKQIDNIVVPDLYLQAETLVHETLGEGNDRES